MKNTNNVLNNTDLLRGIKSTFLRSEDFSFKKGRFSKALEKKSVKSSHKKSSKSIKTNKGKNKIDGKMKLCINAICNKNDNSSIYETEKYRKSKKSNKKVSSHRTILDRVQAKSISGFLSKKGQSGRGVSGKLNLNYLNVQNRTLHSSKPSMHYNFMKKDSYGSKNKFSTLNPSRSSYTKNIHLQDKYIDRTYLEGSKISCTYDHNTLSSMLGSSNRIRDLSSNLKTFKTTGDYRATRHNDRIKNQKKGITTHVGESSSRHKKTKSYRNKSTLGTKYGEFKLDLKPNEFKKKINTLSKQGGVFNYEKTRKNIYENGSFVGHNKENLRYSNLINMTANKPTSIKRTSKYGSSGSKTKTAVKPKTRKNRSISKTKSKLKPKNTKPSSIYNKKNKRSKSKVYKSPQGLKKLKERIREVYNLKKHMNEVKTIKTKSFYAYKSEEDLQLEASPVTPAKLKN